MGAYRTAARRGESVHVVQKSKFLGVCVPVEGEAEAAAAIEAQRKLHHGARHHCYAFVTGSVSRSSDDGEPPGTAGVPILEVLKKNGVCDTLIVVTRYFGGVLLGAGGLARAYTAAAAKALEDARPVTVYEAVLYRIELDYARYSRLPALLRSARAEVVGEEFGGDVKVDLAVRSEDADAFRAAYAALTEGRGIIRETGSGRRAWSDEE